MFWCLDENIMFQLKKCYHSDKTLAEYLNKVYLFSKKESRTTEAETRDAIETAKQVAEIAPSITATEFVAKSLGNNEEAVKTIQVAADNATNDAKIADYMAVDASNAANGTGGGRRLTQKRIFKLKK